MSQNFRRSVTRPGAPPGVSARQRHLFAYPPSRIKHLPLLQKGAILAQNPLDYEELPELTPEDRAAIRYEHENKFVETHLLVNVEVFNYSGAGGVRLGLFSEWNGCVGSTAPDLDWRSA